jgi:DNA polymerase-3 subunit gamma/tau
VLGVTDARLLEASVDAVAEGDARRALQIVATCAEQGRDAASFAIDLEVRARELLVVQTLGEVPSELSLTPEADAALQEQSERVPAPVVVRLLEALGEALEAVRAGADARTRLELALVKAARPDVDSSLRALLDRIERLERGAPIAPPRDTAEVAPGGADATGPVAVEDAPVESAAANGMAIEPVAPQPQPAPSAPEPPAAAVEVSVASIAAVPPRAQEAQGGSPSAQAIAEDLAPLLAWWPAVVDLVRGENALLGACIEEAQPVDVKGEDLVVAFSAAMPFHKKKAETPDNRAAVTAALHDVTGRRWRVSYELQDGIGAGEDDADAPRSEEEWVKRFIEEFDAEELPGDGAHSSEQKGA